MPTSEPNESHRHDAVRVLVVDDHPALRAGLEGLLRQESGFVWLGALATLSGVADAIARTAPDVVVLDYSFEDGDGLRTCFQIKQRSDPPGVVFYTAHGDRVFAVPATLAQCDAMVSKSAPVDDLLSAVQAVASGARRMPPLDRDAMAAASARLSADDLPVAGMLFARVSIPEIAATLGVRPDEVRSRALRIIGAIQSHGRTAAPQSTDIAAVAVR